MHFSQFFPSFNKQLITITAYKSHNTSSFIVKSTSLGYKLQSFKAIYRLAPEKKKNMIILDQMYVCICGTRHSTVVYWPAENTCQLLLSCYSTVTRQAV